MLGIGRGGCLGDKVLASSFRILLKLQLASPNTYLCPLPQWGSDLLLTFPPPSPHQQHLEKTDSIENVSNECPPLFHTTSNWNSPKLKSL